MIDIGKIHEALAEQSDYINLSVPAPGYFRSVIDESKIARKVLKLSRYLAKNPALEVDKKFVDELKKLLVKNSLLDKKREIKGGDFVVNNGINETYFLLLKYFSEIGSVLIPSPVSPFLHELVCKFEFKVKYFALDPELSWGVNFEKFRNQVLTDNKVIFIQWPHFPTGSKLTGQYIEDLATVARDRGLVVVVDVSKSWVNFEKKVLPLDLVGCFGDLPLILIGENSDQIGLPGLRTSWMVFLNADEKLKKIQNEIAYLTDLFGPVDYFSQELLSLIWAKSGKWQKKHQKYLLKQRNVAIEILSKCKYFDFHFPEGGFYLFVRVNSGIELTEEFYIDLLKKAGVFVQSGSWFGETYGDSFVICFAQRNQDLKKGLRALVDYLN